MPADSETLLQPAKAARVVAVLSVARALGVGVAAVLSHWWFLMLIAFLVLQRNVALLVNQRR